MVAAGVQTGFEPGTEGQTAATIGSRRWIPSEWQSPPGQPRTEPVKAEAADPRMPTTRLSTRIEVTARRECRGGRGTAYGRVRLIARTIYRGEH
jgi:hypothetical protein